MRNVERIVYFFNIDFTNFVRRQFYSQYYNFSHTHKPDKFIILFGHQRAGSTLLTKILCSNPEILGYGETHLPYKSNKDIKTISGKILYVFRKWLKNNPTQVEKIKFFFDKSLFNYYVLTDEPTFFLDDTIHIIFLLREPQGAIPSIMNLARLDPHDKPKKYERGACDYYIARLNGMVEYATFFRKNKKPFLTVTYQQIICDTKNLFSQLEGFLGLSHALSEEYDMSMNRIGSGDQSENLLSGKINRNKKSKPNIVISEEIMQEAQCAYDDALGKLLSAGVPILH